MNMKNSPNWHDREKKWAVSNPYLIQQKKTEIALSWVYNWGWTTPFLLDLITQNGKRGFAKKLEQEGLIHSIEIYSFTPGMPRKILRITRKGCPVIGQEYRQKKLNQNTVWHDYIVQIYTAVVLLKNGFPQKNIQYRPFPQKVFSKDYDVVIGKIGVEVELTKKKPIRTNINMFKMLTDIANRKIENIIFVSFSREHIKPYADILKAKKVIEYKYDKYRKPHKVETHSISKHLTRKFKFAILPKPLSVQAILKLVKS